LFILMHLGQEIEGFGKEKQGEGCSGLLKQHGFFVKLNYGGQSWPKLC